MEKEYVMQVAETIRRQLVTLPPTSVLLSWGIDKFIATVGLQGYARTQIHGKRTTAQRICHYHP